MELWFIIALLSAFSVAGCDAVSKKLMLDNDEREQLRQAVVRVEELQKMIHTNFNIV